MGASTNSLELNPGPVVDESHLFDFVVKQGNGVKGLADSGLMSLPRRYVHPPGERIDRKQVIDASPYLGAPIDLSMLEEEKNKEKVMRDLCGAAEKLGFFQVVNHGVSLEVLERVKEAVHGFFNLPPEKKAGYLKGKTPCPNVFYGTSFSPENEESLEWKDYLSLRYMNDDEAMQFWPLECRDAALEYLKSANKMIHLILSTLLQGLGEEVDSSAVNLYDEDKTVNMNFYPICPNPELTVGVGRHSDLTAITVLLQDDIGGLFVKVEDKGWIEIPPVQGALVINIGDTLEILSNGRYKSAEHRAIASSTKDRVSVPIFVTPGPFTMIGPLPGLAEKDDKAVIYRQLLFGEYKNNFFGASHQGKKSLDFAKI
ncbi:Oxoglutarate/iron-dependent dioxygenase [Cinnamomum micranthum f. kanehirae]|uniref:Oxoglutarate/iron-dependent dioxygenase n=1 Tax=Cinnamomum micranthum f. kanehirae TaxID=337451 RepID=A0A3S3N5W2_9MAGN|nr:Oxoglutarate/iron-dependent dioxygenase [Cinnamomum micranthum f. kanehirae]